MIILSDTFYSRKIKTVFYKNGVNHIVKFSTRITQYSRTLIDYIVSNYKELKYIVHQTPRIGDHCILCVELNDYEKIDERSMIKRRKIATYNKENFQESISLASWNHSSTCVKELSNNFTHTNTNILDRMCPIVEISLSKKYTDNKWMNEEIIEAMKLRDLSYKRAVFINHKCQWNEYT